MSINLQSQTTLVPLSARWDDAAQQWVFGNGDSRDATVSDDGRVVAWVSDATNLAPGDDFGTDILLRVLGTRDNVLLAPGADGDHTHPIFLPGAGGAVLFSSTSTNLVAGKATTDEKPDLFIATYAIDAFGQVYDLAYQQLTTDKGAVPLDFRPMGLLPTDAYVLAVAELPSSESPWTHELFQLDGQGRSTSLVRTQKAITAAQWLPHGAVAFTTASAEVDLDDDRRSDVAGRDVNNQSDLFLWRPRGAATGEPEVVRLSVDAAGDAVARSSGTQLVSARDAEGQLVVLSDVIAGQSGAPVSGPPRLLLLSPPETGTGAYFWAPVDSGTSGSYGRLGWVVADPTGGVQLSRMGTDVLLSTSDAAGTQPVAAGHSHVQLVPYMLGSRELGVSTTDIVGSAVAVLFETTVSNRLHFDAPTSAAGTTRQVVLAGHGLGLAPGEAVAIDYAVGGALNPLDADGRAADILLDVTADHVIELETGTLVPRYSGRLSERMGREPIGTFDDTVISLPGVAFNVKSGLGDDLYSGGQPQGYSLPFDLGQRGQIELPAYRLYASIGSEFGNDRLVLAGDRFHEITLFGQVDEVIFAPGATTGSVTAAWIGGSGPVPFRAVTGSQGVDLLTVGPFPGNQLATAQTLDLRSVTFSGLSLPNDAVRVEQWVGTVLASDQIGLQVRSGVADDGQQGVEVKGGKADVVLIAGPGPDRLTEGTGFNRLDYGQSPAAVRVDLEGRVFAGGYANGDDATAGVRVVYGSDAAQGDTLGGSRFADELDGRMGPDGLSGSGGDDVLLGGPGADTLIGGPGNDRLYGREYLSGPGVGDPGDTVKVLELSSAFELRRLDPLTGFDYELADMRLGSPLGTDRIAGIEIFEFADGKFTASQLLTRPPAGATSIVLAASRLTQDEGNPGDPARSFEIVLLRTTDLLLPLDVTIRLRPSTAAGSVSMDASDLQVPLGVDIPGQFGFGRNLLRMELPIQPDRLAEPVESLQVELVGVSRGVLGPQTTAELTLQDDDAVSVSLALQPAAQLALEGAAGAGAGAWTLPLRRTGDLSQELFVTWEIRPDGSPGARPISAQDLGIALGRFVSRFAPDQETISVSVPVRGDGLHEGDETASFVLVDAGTATLGPDASAILTVRDDDPLIVELTGPSQVDEGQPFEVRVQTNEEPGMPHVALDYTVTFNARTAVRPPAGPLPDGGVVHAHRYTDGGVAALPTVERVTLTAFLQGSSTAIDDWIDITVRDVPPVVPVSGSSTAVAGVPWTLNLGAYQDVPGDPLQGLFVDWGASAAAPTPLGAVTPQQALHTFAQPGVHQVQVHARNDDSLFLVGTLQVDVAAEPPPMLAVNGSGLEGDRFTLSISRPQQVQDLSLLTYVVDWGDGRFNTFTGTQLAGASPSWSPTHVYEDEAPGGGPYTIRVLQTLGPVVQQASTAVMVHNVAPTARVQLPATTPLGTDAVLQLSGYVDPGADRPLHLLVEAEGRQMVVPWPVNLVSGSPASLSVPIRFDTPGSRLVTATIVDEDGAFALPGQWVEVIASAQPAAGGTVGSWAGAWSSPLFTLSHTADSTVAAPAWSAVTLSTVSATPPLAGGDLFNGWLGVSGQSMRSSTVRQEIDGREALRIDLTVAARRADFSLERLFKDDLPGGSFTEAGRVRLFLDGAAVGEHVFAGRSGSGRQSETIDLGSAFDRLIFEAGAYDANAVFQPGAGLDAGGQARVGTATASTTGTGSDYLLSALDLYFGDPPPLAPMGVADPPPF